MSFTKLSVNPYNAFKAQGTKEQSWNALQHTINKNYQEGIAQPRLLELANQHLANSFDPTDGILKSELTALKGNRSSFAKNKLFLRGYPDAVYIKFWNEKFSFGTRVFRVNLIFIGKFTMKNLKTCRQIRKPVDKF